MLNRLKRNRSKLLLLASGFVAAVALHFLVRGIWQVEGRTATLIAASILAIPFFLATHRMTGGRGPLSRYTATLLTGVYGLFASSLAVDTLERLWEGQYLWAMVASVITLFSTRMFFRAEKDAGEIFIEDDPEASEAYAESSGVHLRVDENTEVESEPVQSTAVPARNRKRKRRRRKG